jgi:hypothetical protein
MSVEVVYEDNEGYTFAEISSGTGSCCWAKGRVLCSEAHFIDNP